MNKLVLVWLTVISALVASGAIRAEDLLIERLDQLKRTVARQQRELAAFQTAGYTTEIGYTTETGFITGIDDCCYDSGSCRGGAYAAVDSTFLRPYVSGDGLAGLIPAPGPGGIEGEYTFAPRFIIGYEGANGLGVRVRYWFFDQDFALEGVAPTFGIDMDALDLEATTRTEFGEWDLQFAGGARYGREEMSYNGLLVRFEGVGLTAAAEVTRPIYSGNWSLLGNFRGSLLYGDILDTGLILGAGTFTSDDEMMQIWELQLGVQYAREISAGEVAVQFLWETQYWENAWLGSWMSNLGFSGPTLRVEFRR